MSHALVKMQEIMDRLAYDGYDKEVPREKLIRVVKVVRGYTRQTIKHSLEFLEELGWIIVDDDDKINITGKHYDSDSFTSIE